MQRQINATGWWRVNNTLTRVSSAKPEHTMNDESEVGPSAAPRVPVEPGAPYDAIERFEQLSQARKMESVGRLAGGIAHDFNNLLTIIRSYSDLLAEAVGEDSPLRADVREIQDAADRAAALTLRLLAFGRKQVSRPKLMDINALIRECESAIRSQIASGVTLEMNLDPQVGAAKVDPGQIELVLRCLAANANDAMPDGGTLRLSTANVDLDEHSAHTYRALTPGPYVRVSVRDTGSGMDAMTLSHLFEPYFTTHRGTGTGLGLAMVYGIVKQSAGYILAESEMGAGSAIHIYLPRMVKERMAEPSHIPRGSETILLVDDEETVRMPVRRLLQRCGYIVLEARDGLEAVTIAAQHGGPVDLVIADLEMPALAGRAMVERLREGRPTLGALYVSGYSHDAALHRGLVTPENAFLGKPFTLESLARQVRDLLDT
jgi:two-component system, cell cycle sensor histidine kinase and response regulator CckA